MADGWDSEYADMVVRWGELDYQGNYTFHDGPWNPNDSDRVDLVVLKFDEGDYQSWGSDDEGYRSFPYNPELYDLDEFVDDIADDEDNPYF